MGAPRERLFAIGPGGVAAGSQRSLVELKLRPEEQDLAGSATQSEPSGRDGARPVEGLMNGAIFQYQNMMMTVVQGMASGLIPALQTVSYIIMLACLVLGIYEAYAKGGDTRQLAATVMKYVVVAFVVGNWTAFFSDLTTGFNQIAQYIDNSYGAGDLAASWANQLSGSFSQGGY